ncbi:hypothetical protein [Stenomitos frigidus]|uniref:Uncharacterized protein n=1 Tax=Stenomitos frigidus ULC18 TaxID=2107698 RepID=A0A2T1E743_9CYAN|nr:hypothetical protein [Stenomitos frigidus]PSB28494.1 hypothetical protein C7B82_13605 [Stenomitos frigidus ULC18]
MKGYVKDKSIVLVDALPEDIQEGDEVEVVVTLITKRKYPFPTFKLGVKEDYVNRDKIYESD